MKKVGIIGGSELIGSCLSLKFLAEDYKVKVQVSNKRKLKKDPLFENISTNQNLDFYEVDTTNEDEVHNFIEDCELIIHCGEPVCLNLESSETPIFAPVTKQTGNLFKAIQKCKSIKKVIFITSAAAFNSCYSSTNTEGDQVVIIAKNNQGDNAKVHARKAICKVFDTLPANLFEVIFTSPIEVKNHQLSCSMESTTNGLQLLFRKKITPDPYFQKLLERQVIQSHTNIEELPEKVFQTAAIEKMNESLKIKNGQLSAHF